MAKVQLVAAKESVELSRQVLNNLNSTMDGTSTTTEPLALHSLEYMVRRFTGHMEKSDWEGRTSPQGGFTECCELRIVGAS